MTHRMFTPSSHRHANIARVCCAAAVCALVWVSGCSPTFNWRTTQMSGFALTALWPCKPERGQRAVQWETHTLVLHMLSCDVAGQTFAWGAVHLPSGVTAQDFIPVWQQASLNSLQAKPDALETWTPTLRTGLQGWGWRAQGRRHDGQPLIAQAVVVHHRHELHQLVIYGDPKPTLISTWVEGIEGS